jgi:hypothetical protein
MSEQKPKNLEKIAERIARIQDQIRGMDYVSSGTLLKRTKVCGKPGCRCAKAPEDRHGPYYEWGRMKEGRLVHQNIPPDQVPLLRRAIANFRKIRRLLRRWETETARAMKALKDDKT